MGPGQGKTQWVFGFPVSRILHHPPRRGRQIPRWSLQQRSNNITLKREPHPPPGNAGNNVRHAIPM
jgi:hypothetical protein